MVPEVHGCLPSDRVHSEEYRLREAIRAHVERRQRGVGRVDTNRKGEDFTYAGMTTIRVARGKAVLVKDYIFDTSVLARALGEVCLPKTASVRKALSRSVLRG